ncbi:TetR/AcrR family transcriptional regulator [Streptomyces sp. Z26]|uniref:TetR/AcrR family transcriptional regulator n=1 Tax=Streptomyces TaxID=1883 RepID=UPI000EF15AA2|nr:TetR/AcrR family transcriptional regulator [Streptomyces sp. Z26]RLL65746.1 TetR/AcrR family transcriptional regulator [Streptomyces sp. Z26]
MSRTLSTSDARRQEVDAVAVEVFSRRGFYATTTTEIARAAGISQAYLYKLYPDKTSLFVAALKHCGARLAALVEELLARDEDGERALRSAAGDIAGDRDLVRFLAHAACAAHEPEIRAAVAECYATQYAVIRAHSALPDEAIRRYFAESLLDNQMRVIGADRTDAPWARALTGTTPA